jgi:surface antigen
MLAAGSRGRIAFNAGAGSHVCVVTARSGVHRLGPVEDSISDPLVLMTWRVPSSARSLTWAVDIRCASTKRRLARARFDTARISIHGHKKGLSLLFKISSIRFGAYANRAATNPEPELRGGKGGGYVCASAWDGYRSVLDASSYCTGYYTWFVWQKRPEAQLKNLGNAWEWYEEAHLRGIPEGSIPVVGAIAWWNKGPGALSEGHVAYVTAVNGSSVTVEEMNVNGWNEKDKRTFPAQGALPACGQRTVRMSIGRPV